jgi:hypothetical protein
VFMMFLFSPTLIETSSLGILSVHLIIILLQHLMSTAFSLFYSSLVNVDAFIFKVY